ncbi:hypothetical protein [Adhaeribacter aquaticus]|uniref:hypothetical protein n=1 Tax=Adhaeribacter aquaticus TaxID=299567 RepID=UPI0004143D26|nr:hypothetical protein [Adhaeribacter aquaticus]
MGLNIHITKALVLVSLLVLLSIITFNKIIEHNRLEVFQQYNKLILPPQYEVKQNAAWPGNYKTSVWLVIQFDQKNFNWLLKENKIPAFTNLDDQNGWNKSGNT